MVSEVHANVGRWWRFNEYQLLNGVILPAEGARLVPYNPWAEYYAAPRGRKKPYQELIELVESVRLHPGPRFQYSLDKLDESRLLDWCSRNGLLGILPHQALSVSLAPRWQPLMHTEEVRCPSVTRYTRTGLGWKRMETQYADRSSLRIPDAGQTGELVRSDSSDEFLRPKVLIQEIRSMELSEEALTPQWSYFFPAVPEEEWETHAYPLPLTEDFWNEYGEPLNRFFHAALTLRDALEGLRHFKPVSEASEEDLQEALEGRMLLQALISSADPVLIFKEDGTLDQEWACKSLISTLAKMAMDELTSGGRLNRCNVCGTFFTSASHRATYCGERCRHTAQKRAYRERKKQKNG